MPDRLTILLDQNVPQAVVSWLKLLKPTWAVFHTGDVGLSGRRFGKRWHGRNPFTVAAVEAIKGGNAAIYCHGQAYDRDISHHPHRVDLCSAGNGMPTGSLQPSAAIVATVLAT